MTAHAQALPRAALLQMIVGACAISTTSIFVKYAHVGPTLSGFYRMAFGGLMLLGWLLATRQWRPLRWSDIGWLLLPGAAFAVDLVMWHRSILYVGPGLATLLGNFQVFLMALAGWLWYREKLGWWFLAGVALAFFGLYLLVGLDWGAFDGRYRLGVVLGSLKERGYRIAALTPASDAQALDAFAATCGRRTVLLLGAEGPGLSPESLALAERRVRIPITSAVDSLNVVVAAGIALHAVSRGVA